MAKLVHLTTYKTIPFRRLVFYKTISRNNPIEFGGFLFKRTCWFIIETESKQPEFRREKGAAGGE